MLCSGRTIGIGLESALSKFFGSQSPTPVAEYPGSDAMSRPVHLVGVPRQRNAGEIDITTTMYTNINLVDAAHTLNNSGTFHPLPQIVFKTRWLPTSTTRFSLLTTWKGRLRIGWIE